MLQLFKACRVIMQLTVTLKINILFSERVLLLYYLHVDLLNEVYISLIFI